MTAVTYEEQDALCRNAIRHEACGPLDEGCRLTAGPGAEDLQRSILEVDDRLLDLIQGSFSYLLAQLLSPRP